MVVDEASLDAGLSLYTAGGGGVIALCREGQQSCIDQFELGGLGVSKPVFATRGGDLLGSLHVVGTIELVLRGSTLYIACRLAS